MYVIIVYDVDVSRVNKVKSFLRRYLYWVQNSVFEGELTDRQYIEVEMGLLEIIKDQDSVVIYKLGSKKLVKKMVLGVEKSSTDEVI